MDYEEKWNELKYQIKELEEFLIDCSSDDLIERNEILEVKLGLLNIVLNKMNKLEKE